MQWWQHIPEHLDPIALTIGSFSIRWYALFFAAGFILALVHLLRSRQEAIPRETLFDAAIDVFIGVVIGGRLGYVFIYAPAFFLGHPLRIIFPYDETSGWTGLSGMSFHGGLVGASIALLIFALRKKVPFWPLADMFALSAPIALFFGRLGNFLNLELYGRTTESPWGMVFPGAWPIGVPRYPSQLYEAALEGIVLFVLLASLRKRIKMPGAIAAALLILYSVIRFVAEYAREPDPQFGLLAYGFTMGQWLSFVGAVSGTMLIVWLGRKNGGIIGGQK